MIQHEAEALGFEEFQKRSPSAITNANAAQPHDDVSDLPPSLKVPELLAILEQQGRPALLAALKDGGVSTLGKRQQYAGALARRHRNMQPPSPSPPPARPPTQTALPATPGGALNGHGMQLEDWAAALGTVVWPSQADAVPKARERKGARPHAVVKSQQPDDKRDFPATQLAYKMDGWADLLGGANECDGFDERERILRQFDAFHRRHAWRRLEAVDAVWATSDLHVDSVANMAWLDGLAARPNDAVIVAGDVTHNLDQLKQALMKLVSKFKHVFWCAGNHELWYTSKDKPMGLENSYACGDLDLCTSIVLHGI